MTSLTFKPKLFSTLRHYDRRQFTTDLLAGIIVGIVALPLAIAFGIASGAMPVRYMRGTCQWPMSSFTRTSRATI